MYYTLINYDQYWTSCKDYITGSNSHSFNFLAVIQVIHTSHIHSDENIPNDSNQSKTIVGGTTLHLFDEKGLLRMGKQKLYLHTGKEALPLNIFNIGDDSTQGIAIDEECSMRLQLENQENENGAKGYTKDMEYYDTEWTANNILDKLQSYPRKGRQRNLTHTAASTRTPLQSEVSNTMLMSEELVNKHSKGKKNSNAWLDELTISRCHEILAAEIEKASKNVQVCNSTYASKTVLTESYFLVVELPTFTIPVVFEETLYSLSQYGLQGASGSVTALDLALHKQRKSYVSSILSATASLNTDGVPLNCRNDQELDKLSLDHVHLLDPESEDDNPYEDKYRKFNLLAIKFTSVFDYF